MRAVYRILVFLIALSLFGQVYAAESSWDRQARTLLSSYAESDDPVKRWLFVAELEELIPNLGAREQILDTLSRFEHEAGIPLWLKERLKLARWRILRRMGRFSEADEVLSQLGVRNRGYVIGPFENDGGTGMRTQYQPEIGIALGTKVQGRLREVTWRILPIEANQVVWLPFSQLFYPSTKSVAYFLIGIKAARKAKARLVLGFAESVAVFFNGKLGYEFQGRSNGRTEKAYLKLELERGVNLLLIKVGVEDSRSFGLSVRLTGLKSLELPKGVEVTLDPTEIESAASKYWPCSAELAPLAELDSPAKLAANRVEDLRAKLESGRAEPVQLAEALFDLARVLFYTRNFDREERRDEKALEEALELLQDTGAELLLWRAKMTDKPKVRMESLEQAYRIAPFNPRVALAFSKELARSKLLLRAIQVLKEALARHPDDLGLKVMYIRYLVQLSHPLRGVRLFGELLRLYPDNPRLIREYVSALEKAGKTDEVATQRERWLKLELYPPNLWSLYEVYLQRRKLTAAIRMLELLETLYPFSTGTRFNRADIFFGQGQIAQARSVYEEMLAIRPDDPLILEKFASFEALAGNLDAAVRLWRRELKMKPQEVGLKERLAAIEKRKDFAAPYMVDAEQLAEQTPLSADKNANSQILLDQRVVKVYANGLASRRRQLVVRILTEEGKRRWQVFGQVFHAQRQEIKLKSARILRPGEGEISPLLYRSFPWSGNGRMVYDLWVFAVMLDQLKPGDVFEIQLEVDDTAEDNLFHDYFGDLVLVKQDIPVEWFRYVLITPKNKRVYHNKPKFCPEPAVRETTTEVIRTWEGHHIAPIKHEPLMPGYGETSDPLHISTFANWDAFAQWYLGMIREQFTAGPRLKKKVAELVANAKTRWEKLLELFKFVSREVRYIALELGVHSYKPYQANEVLERGYGDCKDKSTLLITMLKEAGIEAELVILRTRDLGRIEPYPPSLAMFNHAIVYVPEFDLFVDATVRNSAMEALPWQDQGAQALVLSSGGARFITIPFTDQRGNFALSQTEVKLSRPGRIEYRAHHVYKGIFAYAARTQLEDRAQQQTIIEKNLNQQSPGANLIEFSIEGIEDPQMPVVVDYTAELRSYLKRQGNRILLGVRLAPSNYTSRYAPLSERESAVVIPYAFCEEEKRHFTLGEGYKIVMLPQASSFKSEFGEFELSCEKLSDSYAICNIRFCLTTTRVEVDKYKEFREFLEKVDFVEGQSLEVLDESPVPAQ